MSDDYQAPGAPQSKNGPNCYVETFQPSDATPFQKALRALNLHRCTARELALFFGNKIAPGTAKHWRLGRRNPPQWAIDIVRLHAERIAELAAQAKAGNHIEAGRRSLQLLNGQRRARRT